jgi:hypothetical protein
MSRAARPTAPTESDGDPGVEDSTGFCDTAPRPAGGPGGLSPAGNVGGPGGQPGNGTASGDDGTTGIGDLGGAGGSGVPAGGNPLFPEYVGDDGGDGADGGAGAAGLAAFTSSGYAPTAGGAGTAGTAGSGAGGGGGGGPSIGVLLGGDSSLDGTMLSFVIGSRGAGGSSDGDPGANGLSAETFIP